MVRVNGQHQKYKHLFVVGDALFCGKPPQINVFIFNTFMSNVPVIYRHAVLTSGMYLGGCVLVCMTTPVI